MAYCYAENDTNYVRFYCSLLALSSLSLVNSTLTVPYLLSNICTFYTYVYCYGLNCGVANAEWNKFWTVTFTGGERYIVWRFVRAFMLRRILRDKAYLPITTDQNNFRFPAIRKLNTQNNINELVKIIIKRVFFCNEPLLNGCNKLKEIFWAYLAYCLYWTRIT